MKQRAKGANKIVVAIVVLLVIVFGAGAFFSGLSPRNTGTVTPTSTDNGGAQATQVVTYAPETVAAGIPEETGSCWTNSVAVPYRTDAWRCTVGNAISDPCFAIPGSSSTLLCDPNPTIPAASSSSTFILKLSKALPPLPTSTPVAPSNWAWAVQLQDGTYCTPFTGTRPFTATGEIGTYACSSQNPDESMILGDINASGTTWMAEVGSLEESTSGPATVRTSKEIPVGIVWQ